MGFLSHSLLCAQLPADTCHLATLAGWKAVPGGVISATLGQPVPPAPSWQPPRDSSGGSRRPDQALICGQSNGARPQRQHSPRAFVLFGLSSPEALSLENQRSLERSPHLLVISAASGLSRAAWPRRGPGEPGRGRTPAPVLAPPRTERIFGWLTPFTSRSSGPQPTCGSRHFRATLSINKPGPEGRPDVSRPSSPALKQGSWKRTGVIAKLMATQVHWPAARGAGRRGRVHPDAQPGASPASSAPTEQREPRGLPRGVC